MSDTLFDIEPVNTGKTCKTCVHRIVYRFSSHCYISFCEAVPSKKTNCGYKRIQSRNHACWRYKEEPKNHEN